MSQGYGKSGTTSSRSVGNYKTLTFIGTEWQRLAIQFKEFPDDASKCLIWMKDVRIDGNKIYFRRSGEKAFVEANWYEKVKNVIPDASFLLDISIKSGSRYHDNQMDEHGSPGLKISVNGQDLKEMLST